MCLLCEFWVFCSETTIKEKEEATDETKTPPEGGAEKNTQTKRRRPQGGDAQTT
jgi:hypothetical protein